MSDSHVSVDSSQDLTGITISSISSGSGSVHSDYAVVNVMSAVTAHTPQKANPKMHSIHDDDDEDDMSDEGEHLVDKDLDVLQSMLDYQLQKENTAKAKTKLLEAKLTAAKKRNDSSMESDISSNKSESKGSLPRTSATDETSEKTNSDQTPHVSLIQLPTYGRAKPATPKSEHAVRPKWKPTLGDTRKGSTTQGKPPDDDISRNLSAIMSEEADKSTGQQDDSLDMDCQQDVGDKKRSMGNRTLQESLNMKVKKDARRDSTPERVKALETPVPVTPPIPTRQNEKAAEAFRIKSRIAAAMTTADQRQVVIDTITTRLQMMGVAYDERTVSRFLQADLQFIIPIIADASGNELVSALNEFRTMIEKEQFKSEVQQQAAHHKTEIEEEAAQAIERDKKKTGQEAEELINAHKDVLRSETFQFAEHVKAEAQSEDEAHQRAKQKLEEELKNKEQLLMNKSMEKKNMMKFADTEYDKLKEANQRTHNVLESELQEANKRLRQVEIERSAQWDREHLQDGPTDVDIRVEKMEAKNDEFRQEYLASKTREIESKRKSEESERNLQEMIERMRLTHVSQIDKLEKHVEEQLNKAAAKEKKSSSKSTARSTDETAKGSDWRPSLEEMMPRFSQTRLRSSTTTTASVQQNQNTNKKNGQDGEEDSKGSTNQNDQNKAPNGGGGGQPPDDRKDGKDKESEKKKEPKNEDPKIITYQILKIKRDQDGGMFVIFTMAPSTSKGEEQVEVWWGLYQNGDEMQGPNAEELGIATRRSLGLPGHPPNGQEVRIISMNGRTYAKREMILQTIPKEGVTLRPDPPPKSDDEKEKQTDEKKPKKSKPKEDPDDGDDDDDDDDDDGHWTGSDKDDDDSVDKNGKRKKYSQNEINQEMIKILNKLSKSTAKDNDNKRKPKEQDKIHSFPKDLPNPRTLRKWKVAAISAVSQAAGTKDVVKWMNEISKLSYDELADAGKFESMDLKLASAIQSVLLKSKTRISARLLNKAREEIENDRMITGRQWCHMLYYGTRTSKESRNMYDLSHLYKVNWYGDDQMEKFLDKWDYVVTGMKEKPTDDAKRNLFLKQLRKSKALEHDIAYLDRLADDHADYSFDWMWKRVENCIDREEMMRNEKELEKAGDGSGSDRDHRGRRNHRNRRNRYDSAPGTPPGKKGKSKKSKGKGKGGKSSGSGSDTSKPYDRVCHQWRDGGTCSYGDKCRFEHPDKDGNCQKKITRDASPAVRRRLCSHYKAGNCRFGDDCRNSHGSADRYRSRSGSKSSYSYDKRKRRSSSYSRKDRSPGRRNDSRDRGRSSSRSRKGGRKGGKGKGKYRNRSRSSSNGRSSRGGYGRRGKSKGGGKGGRKSGYRRKRYPGAPATGSDNEEPEEKVYKDKGKKGKKKEEEYEDDEEEYDVEEEESEEEYSEDDSSYEVETEEDDDEDP